MNRGYGGGNFRRGGFGGRGRGSGGYGGRGGGYGGRGGRGGGGYRNREEEGPPDTVVESGAFVHDCQGEMVYRMTSSAQVPKFNAPVYLENKTEIGRIEEVLGPISEVYFSVRPVAGVVAKSFEAGDRVFLGPDKLMPLQRFLQPSGGVSKGAGGRGHASRGGRGNRGGRGGGRGGRGGRGFGGNRGRGGGMGGFGRGGRSLRSRGRGGSGGWR